MLNMRDIEAQAKALAPVIARLVAREVAAARKELLDVIEQKNKQIDQIMERAASVVSDEAIGVAIARALQAIPAPKDGKDADPEVIRAMVADEVAKSSAPKSEQSVGLEEVRRMVDAAVAEAVKAIPVPKDGRSVTLDDVRPVIDDAVRAMRKDADVAFREVLESAEKMRDRLAEAIGTLRQPEDGKSVTLEDVAPLIERAVAQIPAPRDGKDGASVTLDDVRPIIEKALDDARCEALEKVEEAIRAMPTPRDGKDGESFTIEDAEKLLDAKVSRWALDFERRASEALERAIARIPPPRDGKDGRDGRDGRDGVGFDDLGVEYDGERAVSLVFTKGDTVKRFDLRLPLVIDRGIYRPDMEIKAGDGVTWAGSYWIAQTDAPIGKPGEPGSDGWRLAVKRGRDGRDGRNGIDFTKPVRLEDKT